MRTILERRDMDSGRGRRLAGLAQLLAFLVLFPLGPAAFGSAGALLAQRGRGLVDQLAQLLELVALADAARADLFAADDRLQVLLEAIHRAGDAESHEDADRD